VRLALKAVMQNDGDFVDAVLLCFIFAPLKTFEIMDEITSKYIPAPLIMYYSMTRRENGGKSASILNLHTRGR
jgi:hypothetical protein